MSESTGKSEKTTGMQVTRSTLYFVVLFIVLAIAAVGVGVGLKTTASSTQYACFSFTHQGNNVEVLTPGIIHISGSQYYVTCAEGAPAPTAGTSVSCLTISPQLRTFTYPSSSTVIVYNLSAPTNAIVLPSHAPNATEIVAQESTITVNC